MLGLTLQVLSTALTDVGSLLLLIPRQPTAALPGVCSEAVVQVAPNVTLDGCALLAGCFATPSVDVLTAVAGPDPMRTLSTVSGLPFDGATPSLLANASSFLHAVNVSALDSLGSGGPLFNLSVIADALLPLQQTIDEFEGLSALLLGVPFDNPYFNRVDVLISNVTATLRALEPLLSSPGPLVQNGLWALENATSVVDDLKSLLGLVAAVLASPERFACGWVRDGWDGVITPLRGAVASAVAHAARASQLAACFGFGLVAALILVQIRCGGAGRPARAAIEDAAPLRDAIELSGKPPRMPWPTGAVVVVGAGGKAGHVGAQVADDI